MNAIAISQLPSVQLPPTDLSTPGKSLQPQGIVKTLISPDGAIPVKTSIPQKGAAKRRPETKTSSLSAIGADRDRLPHTTTFMAQRARVSDPPLSSIKGSHLTSGAERLLMSTSVGRASRSQTTAERASLRPEDEELDELQTKSAIELEAKGALREQQRTPLAESWDDDVAELGPGDSFSQVDHDEPEERRRSESFKAR